jgi:hypothetical protein
MTGNELLKAPTSRRAMRRTRPTVSYCPQTLHEARLGDLMRTDILADILT